MIYHKSVTGRHKVLFLFCALSKKAHIMWVYNHDRSMRYRYYYDKMKIGCHVNIKEDEYRTDIIFIIKSTFYNENNTNFKRKNK
jgi:hypothetical protein